MKIGDNMFFSEGDVFFKRKKIYKEIEKLEIGQCAHISDPRTLSNMSLTRNKDGSYDMQLPPFSFKDANSVVDALVSWFHLEEGKTRIDFYTYEEDKSILVELTSDQMPSCP